MKTFVIGLLSLFYVAVLYRYDWNFVLFFIPFLVGTMYVVWNALIYSAQMEEMAEETLREHGFVLVEKDGLTYIEMR